MNKTINLIFAGLITLVFSSCNFDGIQEQANQQFGDQHFKTAIALIELYKVRHGEYPPTLDSLSYIGDWDKIIFNSVKYKRLDEGYELDLVKGWIGKPEGLAYPEDFWKGLGVVRSNLKN